MAELIVRELVKIYGSAAAVDGISFDVADGEFVTLLGPSGCGKSTTLSAVAGLDHPDRGHIRAGRTVFFDSATGTALPPEARNCGLVFQAYALWPHMSVRQNVAFPLRLRKVSAAEQRRRVDDVLALVEMSRFADRYPHQLSGGQQQRVALARTLVYEPAILLLDEPLSNLDAKLRERARAWLAQLHRQVRRTTLYVTHDQIEALALSDRIIVMNGGQIVQIGTPREIYETPQDPFVADFIGTSSFLAGRARRHGGGGAEAEIELGGGHAVTAVAPQPLAANAAVTVALRPERLQLCADGVAPQGERGTLLPARVLSRTYIGARFQYELEIGRSVVKTEATAHLAGETAGLWIPAGACIAFPDDRAASA